MGRSKRLGVLRAKGKINFRNFRNDISATLNDNRIPHSDVKAFDFFEIVQGGATNCHSAQRHGFKIGNGSESARAPDLQHNVVESRFRLSRREFYGNSPTW